MAESTRHITIQRGDELPELQQCNTCCSYYHCPFCSVSLFKPAKLIKLKSHLQSHFNKAVVHGGFTIHRCGLGCRTALHHHCLYCETTVLRRSDFEKHVQVCEKKTVPTSATISSPAPAALATPSPASAALTTPSPAPAALTTPSPASAALTTPSPAPAALTTPSPASAALTTPSPAPAALTTPSPASAALTTPSPASAALTTPSPASAALTTPSPAPAALTTPSPASAALTTPSPAPAALTTPSPASAALTTPSPASAALTTPSPASAALTTPSPAPAALTTPMVSSGRVRVRPVIKKKCPVCNMFINRKNLKKHIDRKHTKQPIQDINATFHLASQCIDRTNGIFTVLKVSKGHSVPLHIQLKTWGEHHKVICESHECQVNLEVAQRSGLSSYQCKHIRSVTYCASSAEQVYLKEEILTEMVKAKWFSNEKKKICLTRQELANSNCIPLSVQTSIGTPETKKLISVFEPSVSYYSRLGRVMVVYDSKLNTWHCPCAKLRRSCVHKCIAKWHLFQTERELFRTVFSREESPHKAPHVQSEENDFREDGPVYPPKDLGLNNIVCYILQHKKIPADLPHDVRVPSPDKDYPRNLCPDESICQSCPGVIPLSDPILITKKAKILTNWSIIEDVATYCKQCPLCGMLYRYQEWKDHLHNFNDHIILAIPLCLTLRSLLQVHTSVSRAVEFLQDLTGLKFPAPDTVLHAYLHFEALTEHEYKYSCVSCGDNPPVVIMDLHKKGVFQFSASDIKEPPENFQGDVNLETFWEALSKEMIGRGFVASGAQNPFAVKPTYHFWAPWIGKNTRRSDRVLNTEYEKLHSSKSASETAEITVTEERLKEELLKQKVNVIRKLCKECGLDSTGSRSDLLLRLSNEMKSRQTYDKIFEKIWGASGGWGVIMCPCGIVYSLKCNLRAESPRDFVDLLFSWKHLPNIIIYDFARGLATHANLRAPESIPIRPYEGRLAEPTEENIKLAKSGNLKVSLPWLEEKKSVSDPQGHPLTGSSEHYVLSDRFHESNTKDSRDVLRKITIVPQLAGKINSQVAEQLFSKMRKNNYFLNMSHPSTHLFQMRTIIHHYNENKNNKVRSRLMKTFGSKLLKNMQGQAVLENSNISTEEPVPTDIEMEDTTTTSIPTSTENEMVCNIKHLSASRVCWDCLPSPRQLAMLEWALGTDDPDETIAEVGNLVLKRKDFWTLGLNEWLEGTIANGCLEVIALVAKEQGMDVWMANTYVVVTWLPPNNLDPALSFPDYIGLKDCIVFPAWKPGHWMLCVMKPKDRHMYFLDSTNPYGLGDERYVNVFSKMTAKIAPGTWLLLKNMDIPQQIGGMDCGVFMLMYALHLVLGAPFDFTSCDFPNIRKWWALILLENFGVFPESAETLQESYPREEQASLSSNEELPIIQHMLEAVKWLQSNRHLFRGTVEEPLFLRMDKEDKEKALANVLEESEGYREPFVFHFEFREDMEIFLQECLDKMRLRLNASFDKH